MARDLAVHLAALEELHWRQPQPLLLDLGRVRGESARHHAADVGPVAGVLQPAEQLAIDEERHGEAHVHEMRAAEIGIVDDVDVAGLRRRGLALADQPDQLGASNTASCRRRPAGRTRPARSARRCRAS